jgi:hypothetical protein
MTRSTTKTRPEATDAPSGADATEVETEVPAERQARAEAALQSTTERITALDAQITAMIERLGALVEQEAHTYDAANALARELHALPAAIDAARARALVASEVSRDSALRAVEHLRERFATLTQQEAEALTGADATRHALATERERIEAERIAAGSERADLAGLIAHLHAEIAAARSAAGEALAQQLRAERSTLEAARTAATAQLDQSQAAIAAFEERARTALRTYPQALTDVEGTPLLPRPQARPERAIAAYLNLLDILAEGPFQPVELQSGGDVALGRAISIEPTIAFAWALSGYSGTSEFWDARRRLAARYLENYRQQSSR